MQQKTLTRAWRFPFQGIQRARDVGFIDWNSGSSTWSLDEYEHYEQVRPSQREAAVHTRQEGASRLLTHLLRQAACIRATERARVHPSVSCRKATKKEHFTVLVGPCRPFGAYNRPPPC